MLQSRQYDQPAHIGLSASIPMVASHTSSGLSEHSGSGQLIWSCNGLLVVHSDAGQWVVPPTALLRLSAGLAYRIRKADSVQVNILDIASGVARHLAVHSCLYRMTPLLRELLQALVMPGDRNPCQDSRDSRAVLLVDLLNEAKTWIKAPGAQALGTPNDPRVARICDYIRNNLDSPRTLQEWASELKHDPRTLHRLFVQEFGMPFVQWRQQARLMAALEWLADGRPVMDVALDLGYQTQSAFTAMFRRNMGITPTEWQEKRRVQYCRLR